MLGVGDAVDAAVRDCGTCSQIIQFRQLNLLAAFEPYDRAAHGHLTSSPDEMSPAVTPVACCTSSATLLGHERR